MSRLLEVIGVKRYFEIGKPSWRARLRSGHARPHRLHAVDDVSFQMAPGESVGLVGESGCGKSTLVRLITRTLALGDGDILFQGRNIGWLAPRQFSTLPQRAKIQMVFQDPTDSLNPRYTAFETIAEPLRLLLGVRDRSGLAARVTEAADRVGLPRELLSRFPHQLSGGQKARVGIARAIAVKPELLVLDEPTAALDVSVQATVLHLLVALKGQLQMSYLFVSHDLNVVRLLCDRVLVMYLGKIVESGPAEEVFERPLHPYTQALIAAIPGGHGTPDAQVLSADPRSPIDPAPTVCRFYGRCPCGQAHCTEQMPELRERRPQHSVACHFAKAG